jgi:hypothetical protein
VKRSGQLQRRPFPVPVGKDGQIVWSSLTRHQELGRGTRLAVVRGDGAPVMPIRRTRNSGPTPDVRKRVLERDGYSCVCCGKSIIGQRYSLGHRLRASQGGKAVAENLLVFLGWGGEACHGRIDLYRDPADEIKGYRIPSGNGPEHDPLHVPVTLFTGATVWLTPDGRYSHQPPDGAVA